MQVCTCGICSIFNTRVTRLSGDIVKVILYDRWTSRVNFVNAPIFVSGSPPVRISHLQDGVLFILLQLQVLWCHGCVIILCYDSHAYLWSRRLRRQKLNRALLKLINLMDQSSKNVNSIWKDCLYLCWGRGKRFPRSPSVRWFRSKACSWHHLWYKWNVFSQRF